MPGLTEGVLPGTFKILESLACAGVENGRHGHHLVHVSFVSEERILEQRRKILKHICIYIQAFRHN